MALLLVSDIKDSVWDQDLPQARTLAEQAAAAAFGAGSRLELWQSRDAEVGLCLVSDGEIQTYNRDFRGKDQPTNVLSFPAFDPDEPLVPEGPVALGDIVIARETLLVEAARDGLSLKDHFTHLVVHGILHLLGFDHEDDQSAEEMESLETRILAELGIADPYQPR